MRMPAGSLREEGLGSGERRRAERRVSLLSEFFWPFFFFFVCVLERGWGEIR